MRKSLRECPEPDLKRFYYYRDPHDKAPRVTVCLAKFGNTITRGMAICSFSEKQIIKEYGRYKAYQRAKIAYVEQCSSMPIFREAAESMLEICELASTFVGIDMCVYKSYLNPSLTEFENKLMQCESSKQ